MRTLEWSRGSQCNLPQVWRPTAYRLAGGHNQSALNTASYDLKCEATREMFVDEELMAQADYLVRPLGFRY